jgi:monoamine oxidase
MKTGYDVIVLEAQDRPGGRVHTVRDGFRRGGFAEMGALRIFETHEYTNKYVRAFGLQLVPYRDSGSRAFYLEGRRLLEPAAGQPWPLSGMTAEERADPLAFFPKYLESGFGKLGDLFDPDWPAAFPTALELDRVTVGQYMQDQGASDSWLNWFCAREGNVRRMNAAAAFAIEAINRGTTTQGIKGGNDRLPRAFATALGRRVKYRSPVVRIAQNRRQVIVTYRNRGALGEIRADHCVCALPFAPLRRVSIETPFSDEKMASIQRLRYLPAARCYFQTRTRFWRHDPLGALGGLNMLGTDTMAGRVWNTSAQQPDPLLGMLHSYMFDTEALAFAAHGRCRVRAMRRIFEKLMPGIGEQIIGVNHKAWQEDPWAGGGWGWTQPEEMRWMFPAMRRAEGRVHFAGEHTSLYMTWMNGALEAGERAAKEIVAADAAK